MKRLPSEERRPQIVQAALDLLAGTSVERLSTRQIAERVGISQPALFRHFASRDAIFEAVVAQTRAGLEPLIEQAVLRGGLDAVGVLARGLFAYIEENPGLPRLLFHDLAGGESPYHASLVHLASMQRNLVAELVRDAQRSGAAPASVDPAQAGALFVALVQGTLLQARLGEGHAPGADGLVAVWRAAIDSGEPRGVSRSAEALEPLPALATLDVRPLLAEGTDPLEAILAHLARLPSDGVLKLTAPFRPTPLLTLLEGRGYRVTSTEVDRKTWVVEVLAPAAPEPVDLRDLHAPEPMERVLLAVSRLKPGEGYLARVPRVPRPLLAQLASRGLLALAHKEHDRSALIYVHAEGSGGSTS